MFPDNVATEDSFTTKAEGLIFGRKRKTDEPFGVYRRLVIAQATSPEVTRVCQDGGAATALLLFAMEKGIADAALVTGTHPTKPFFPIPKLAINSHNILEAAGSKYTCSQSPLTLASGASKMRKGKIVFVGTPCQVRAFRRPQMSRPSKLDFVNFTMGLMCSGCFNHELITEFIKGKLGINPTSILKMNIKGKLLITTNAGVTAIPLPEIKNYKRSGCAVCHDFSSELADISVGGLGLDGWTFTVIRSEKGEELFTNAEEAGFLRTQPVDSETAALRLLIKLSQKKKNNAWRKR